MAKRRSGSEPIESESSRDAKGRFKRGASGNPAGRPTKKPKLILNLGETFAEVLAEKVSFTDANGQTRMLTNYEAIVRRIIDEARSAKPREALDLLERLDKLDIHRLMSQKMNPSINIAEAIWDDMGISEADRNL